MIAGELADCLHGIPKRQSDELDFIPPLFAQQLRALVALHPMNAGQDFAGEQLPVGFSILRCRVAVPDAN